MVSGTSSRVAAPSHSSSRCSRFRRADIPPRRSGRPSRWFACRAWRVPTKTYRGSRHRYDSAEYDSTTGQFIQKWKTPPGAGRCYSVTVTTADGSSLTAVFKTSSGSRRRNGEPDCLGRYRGARHNVNVLTEFISALLSPDLEVDLADVVTSGGRAPPRRSELERVKAERWGDRAAHERVPDRARPREGWRPAKRQVGRQPGVVVPSRDRSQAHSTWAGTRRRRCRVGAGRRCDEARVRRIRSHDASPMVRLLEEEPDRGPTRLATFQRTIRPPDAAADRAARSWIGRRGCGPPLDFGTQWARHRGRCPLSQAQHESRPRAQPAFVSSLDCRARTIA